MSQATKQETTTANATSSRESPPPYRRVYAWVFQVWLIMFLGVISCALGFYLLSYIPK